jgi:hypothetical protein
MNKALCDVWTSADCSAYIAVLKNRTLGSKELLSSSCSVTVSLGNTSDAHDVAAILNLEISSSNNHNSGPGSDNNSVSLDFTRDGLYDFLVQLDKIQSKFDSLSSRQQ